MDHLLVSHPGQFYEQDAVPYVCRESYDRGPFLTYPVRMGRTHVLPNAGAVLDQYNPTPTQDLEDFFQTWLFFGLINEFLGDLCKADDFICVGGRDDKTTVSTVLLVELVDMWVERLKNGKISLQYEYIGECLRSVFAALGVAGPDFDFRIKYSILSTGELFEFAANKAFDMMNIQHNRCPGHWLRRRDDDPWRARMQGLGWCPSEIEKTLETTFNIQALYFFSSMSNKPSIGQHATCSRQRCLANQIDVKNYKTQHVCGTHCRDLIIDAVKLDEIVKGGSLPLLQICQEGSLDTLTASVERSNSQSSYVAISHVWADGLGNPDANALPICQVQRLSALVQKVLPGDTFLWCDTLCCPTGPPDAKDRSLEQMKIVYEQASAVLVLDASLQCYDGKALCLEEVCFRILSCGRMRRFWTLQEGALPAKENRLYFQFRDQAINVRDLWQQVLTVHSKDLSRYGLAAAIISGFRGFTSLLQSAPDDPGADLDSLESALWYRSVSVPTDEPLLVGTLLNLKISTILKGPITDRMCRLWSLMPTAKGGLPKSILFYLSPRLGQGFRWAPSSLLACRQDNRVLGTMREGDNQGRPTSRGLEVCLAGSKVSFRKPLEGLPANPWSVGSFENTLYMRDYHGGWYSVQRRGDNSNGDYLSSDLLSDIIHSHHSLWITYLETKFQTRSDGRQQTQIALLVKVVEEENGIKFAESYMHLHVKLLDLAIQDMWEAAYQCADTLAREDMTRQIAILIQESDFDPESPRSWKTIWHSLITEISNLPTSGLYEKIISTAERASVKQLPDLFGVFVRMVFTGRYALVGRRTAETQKWCID